MELIPNVVKTWAIGHGVPFIDAAKLGNEVISILSGSPASQSHVFIVASYGKIIPKTVLDIPKHKTLNIHPSLLPKYRGPSPLPSVMLADDKKTGVTIMRLDEEMDHGPIVAQREIVVEEWPEYDEFEAMMAAEGARLLLEVLPRWVGGEIPEISQDHSLATYTKKISKEDGLIEPGADPYLNFRKIQAHHSWPQAYFFISHRGRNVRVKVTKASFASGKLKIEKVIPEGGKEITYDDFKRGYGNAAGLFE